MQTHKSWAWGLLLIVLGLDGVAYWAMVWQAPTKTSPRASSRRRPSSPGLSRTCRSTASSFWWTPAILPRQRRWTPRCWPRP